MLGFLNRWSVDSLDSQIKSVVNEYHWPPNVIDDLYLDDIDHHGLLYWYNNVKEMHDKLKAKK